MLRFPSTTYLQRHNVWVLHHLCCHFSINRMSLRASPVCWSGHPDSLASFRNLCDYLMGSRDGVRACWGLENFWLPNSGSRLGRAPWGRESLETEGRACSPGSWLCCTCSLIVVRLGLVPRWMFWLVLVETFPSMSHYFPGMKSTSRTGVVLFLCSRRPFSFEVWWNFPTDRSAV